MSVLTGKHVLVLGLGESGLAMARWCALRGARVRVADSRRVPPGRDALREDAPLAELISGDFGAEVLDGVDLVALSPGLDPRVGVVAEARRRGLPISGEITLLADALRELGVREHTRILAITGTNGKTTTTALSAALARSVGVDAVAAGNISPAALDVLMERLELGLALPECWVLELSSFQIETMHGLDADAATVLNVSDDHLDRYPSVQDYAATKAVIFQGNGVQVLNRDDARVAAMALPGRRVIRFGVQAPEGVEDYGIARRDGADWLVRGEQALIALADLPLAGRHNAMNVLAALALCESGLGIEPKRLITGLLAFRGLPHRVQLVAERADGVRFYDDSKGTNVGAAVAALAGFDAPVVLIAGGDGKGQDFAPLAALIAHKARAVVLMGRDAARIEAALAGVGACADAGKGAGVRIERATDLDDAVLRAARLAHAGDIVLLSPACASLDMFRNYVHRAEVFVAAARRLPEVEAR